MLSEKGRSQQTALWELVETEVAYIRTLKVIQDVNTHTFLAQFTKVSKSMIYNLALLELLV